MKRARRTYALGVSAMVFAYLAIAIGTQVYVRAKSLPELDAGREKLDRFETRILADLKLLAEKPVFATGARETNAERFLTGFIVWTGADDLHSLEHDRLVESMDRHADALKPDTWKSAATWTGLVEDDSIYDLDLAWVDQLSAYDSLDIATHPRARELLAQAGDAHGLARLELFSELPTPRFDELRYAALVRAAQLAREKQARDAMTLYRHVSRLMATSDSRAGALSSVSMLESEKTLADRLGVAWTPIDGDRLDAMKRTSWMWPGLIRARAALGSLGAFEPFLTRETNACVWVYENAGLELILSEYLQPTVVFEPNLNERLERERGVLTKALASCDHADFGAFFTPVESPLTVGRGRPNPARLPFLRRVIGLNLVARAASDDFRFYEESPRRPAAE